MDISNEIKRGKRRDHYATYCEADDVMRVYVFSPLPNRAEERLRKAGFEWLPDLFQFIVDGWSASRELLLVRMFGEMNDDSTNLVDERRRSASGHRSDRARVEYQRQQFKLDQANKLLELWQEPDLSRWQMLVLANFNHASYRFRNGQGEKAGRGRGLIGSVDIWSALQYRVIDEARAKALAIASYRSSIECAQRWIDTYEKELKSASKS